MRCADPFPFIFFCGSPETGRILKDVKGKSKHFSPRRKMIGQRGTHGEALAQLPVAQIAQRLDHHGRSGNGNESIGNALG
jgi:hypothetical protein